MRQARIYSALALKNIQASLMFLARLCYIFGGSEIYRLPSAFLSTDIEKGKVFGLNTLRRRKILPETACRPDLSTFKGYCTTFADEQRKGANDVIGELIYRRFMIDQIKFYPAIMKNAPSFCSFIKKLYLCVSGVMSLMQNNKEL